MRPKIQPQVRLVPIVKAPDLGYTVIQRVILCLLQNNLQYIS